MEFAVIPYMFPLRIDAPATQFHALKHCGLPISRRPRTRLDDRCRTKTRRRQDGTLALISNITMHNGGMEFVLTEHAEKEAQRRLIDLTWIESIMSRPEQTLPGTNNRKVLQSRIVSEGKTYLVRLIVEDWHHPPVIVTVYRASKIEKYWRQT